MSGQAAQGSDPEPEDIAGYERVELGHGLVAVYVLDRQARATRKAPPPAKGRRRR